jgi:hypothetical protein
LLSPDCKGPRVDPARAHAWIVDARVGFAEQRAYRVADVAGRRHAVCGLHALHAWRARWRAAGGGGRVALHPRRGAGRWRSRVHRLRVQKESVAPGSVAAQAARAWPRVCVLDLSEMGRGKRVEQHWTDNVCILPLGRNANAGVCAVDGTVGTLETLKAWRWARYQLTNPPMQEHGPLTTRCPSRLPTSACRCSSKDHVIE